MFRSVRCRANNAVARIQGEQHTGDMDGIDVLFSEAERCEYADVAQAFERSEAQARERADELGVAEGPGVEDVPTCPDADGALAEQYRGIGRRTVRRGTRTEMMTRTRTSTIACCCNGCCGAVSRVRRRR